MRRTNYRIRRLRLSRLLLVQETRHPSPRIIRTFGGMKPFHRFSAFLLARVTVKPSTLTRSVSLLRIFLEERGFEGAQSFSNDTCSKLVQEAWRRTAELEPDKIARCGPFYRQLDMLAGETVAAIHGSPNADLRIRQILEFSGIQ